MCSDNGIWSAESPISEGGQYIRMKPMDSWIAAIGARQFDMFWEPSISNSPAQMTQEPGSIAIGVNRVLLKEPHVVQTF